jgi:hypothetical protein
MPARFHDECRVLESGSLQRTGYLQAGHSGLWEWPSIGGMEPFAAVVIAENAAIKLHYFLDATNEEMHQRVELKWLPCPTRGGRFLFHCPACGRRCMKLFGWSDRRFACRDCQSLAYKSQRQSEFQRMLRRIFQIGPPLIGAPVGGQVPLSWRERIRPRRRLMRNRLRAAIAAVLLSKD